MDIADAWAVRYYEWSLQQAEQEFKEGFPLLSLVCGRIGFATVEYAKSLDSHDRIQLATALVKRLNSRALAIKGETLDVAESRVLEGFLTHDKTTGVEGRVGTPPFASEKHRIRAGKIDSGVASKGDRLTVRRMVTQQLEKLFGGSVSKPSGAVKYEVERSGWRMKTTIDYGGSHGQITYAHVLIPPGGRPLFPPIHLCGWLGIAGQTSWDQYTSEQEEEVATGLVQIVTWFTARWHGLTNDLH